MLPGSAGDCVGFGVGLYEFDGVAAGDVAVGDGTATVGVDDGVLPPGVEEFELVFDVTCLPEFR